jgi:hypothetical protein
MDRWMDWGEKKENEVLNVMRRVRAGNFPSRNDVERRVPERRPTTLTMPSLSLYIFHPTNSPAQEPEIFPVTVYILYKRIERDFIPFFFYFSSAVLSFLFFLSSFFEPSHSSFF